MGVNAQFKFLKLLRTNHAISLLGVFIPILLFGWLYGVNFFVSLFFACAGVAMLLAIGMIGFLLRLVAAAIAPKLDAAANSMDAAIAPKLDAAANSMDAVLTLFIRKSLVILAKTLLILLFALMLYSIWLGTISPLLVWLEHGKWPERDLLYLLGSSDCSESYWRSSWQTLKDWCRPESISVTNWVGVDKLLNYLLDVNVSLVGITVSFLVMSKVMGFLDNVGASDQSKASPPETENETDNV